MEEKFESFLSIYFGDNYDKEGSRKWFAVIYEIGLYFEEDACGGWSILYCKGTWNVETLENEADLKIFDLLLKIDIKNGADTSRIVESLCLRGAFEAVKARNLFLFHEILSLVFLFRIIQVYSPLSP